MASSIKCGTCGKYFLASTAGVDRHLSSKGHKAAQTKTLKRLDTAAARDRGGHPGAYKKTMDRIHATQTRRHAAPTRQHKSRSR